MSTRIIASGLTTQDKAQLAAQPRAKDVLEFWFGEDWQTKGLNDPKDMMPLWFGKADGLDEVIARRFGADIDALLAGRLKAWREGGPLTTLAGIILGDQFTRSTRRGMASMYDGDEMILAWSKGLMKQDGFARMPIIMRQFAAMPLMHSENLSDQEDMLLLIKAWIREATAAADQAVMLEFLNMAVPFAEDHVAVVQKWGRFPHRNAILGRASTPEEVAGLADGTIKGW